MTRFKNLKLCFWIFLLFSPIAPTLQAQTAATPYCFSMPAQKPWPVPATDAFTLHRHETQPGKDISTASSFEAWRSFSSGKVIYLDVCYGNIRVQVSPSAHTVHLFIRLSKELPKGKTVSDFIQQFSVDSKRMELRLKAPELYGPEITIEVPPDTSFKVALALGTAEFWQIPGNIDIGIGKGDLLLHVNSKADYAAIDGGFRVGGMRDKRPGVKSVGHGTGGWADEGTGKYKVAFGVTSGHLILLPAKTP